MPLVYMLSDHGEYGSEHVSATLDKGKVPAMLEAYPGVKDQHRAALQDALNNDAPAVYEISEYWGGYQLHIIELDADPQG